MKQITEPSNLEIEIVLGLITATPLWRNDHTKATISCHPTVTFNVGSWRYHGAIDHGVIMALLS